MKHPNGFSNAPLIPIRVATIAVILACLGACHRSPPPQSTPTVARTQTAPAIQTPAPTNAEPLPQELPAFYSGVLPCADCEGIRYELDLRRDQVFFARMTYLNKPRPNVFDQIGRWMLGEDRVLTLDHGDASPELWSMTDVTTLHKLDLNGQPIASDHNFILARQSSYQSLEPALEMQGMYHRVGEGAAFEECKTGLRLALAPDSNRADLDAAYARARGTTEAPALVMLQGRILKARPEQTAVSDILMVDAFKSLAPNETCGARGVTHDLEGTRWALVRLNETSIKLRNDQREPFLVLEPSEHRVAGHGGCNRIVGRYELTGQTIHFTELAMTRMACPDMQIEDALQKALTSATSWSIEGAQLKLLDQAGEIIARFEARNL